MKNFCLIFSLAILFCILVAGIFLGIGILTSIFLPITAFHAALLLIVPFSILLILLPLLLINQRLEDMMLMMEEDYMIWDEENWGENIIRKEKKRSQPSNHKNRKIIVMGTSPIIDKNAPCPCGSGKKYKNCCDETGKTTQKEGE